MSAFGYGNSYKVTNQGAPGIQENPQSSPSFSSQGMPSRGGVAPSGPSALSQSLPSMDFTPKPTNPWEADVRRAGFNGHRTWYNQMPWENPMQNFDNLFGGMRVTPVNVNLGPQSGFVQEDGRIVGNREAVPGTQRVENTYYFQGFEDRPYAGFQSNPVQSFDNLNRNIRDATTQNLIQADYNNAYSNSFSGAAQDFSNAFASEAFTSDAKRLSPNFNQENVGNWLQDSYNRLVQRLDDNWLL